MEIPPKLITKLAKITASFMFDRVDKLKQPFVISTMPSSKAEIFSGNRLKIGDRHSIIIKNMVIMQPTDSMARVEERTISLISGVFSFARFKFVSLF